jgi:autotransporter-associated beta strand protein
MKSTRTNPFAALQLSAITLPSAAFTLACTFLIASQSAQAAALTWDTTSGDGTAITAGTGDWNTTAGNLVWNNAGSNVPWTQTNTTTALNSAIFAGTDAIAETYVVTLGSQIATSGLTFNNTGYRLAGTSGLSFPVNTIIETAAGKSVTIACPLIGTNVANSWLARLDSTVNVTGNTTSTQQPTFVGESGVGTTGKFNFSGNATFSVLTINAPINITDGTFASGTSLFIGRGGRAAVNTVTSSTGTVTLDGTNAIFNHNGGGTGNNTMLGRDGGTGALVIKNGAFNTATSSNTHDVAIAQDNNGASKGTFDVQGGTVTIGSTTNNTAKINFGRVGLTSTQVANMIQSGGTITSYGGVLFGGATAGTYTGTAVWTMTGGIIYLGAGGISEGTLSAAETITLSGGTVGAIASWTGSLPMALDTINGDITFKCADSFDLPFDISLTQALTGGGGLKKTGLGKLTLSGVNSYSGTTLVSDGILSRVTGATPSINGPLTLNGSAGSPTVSMIVSNSNQYWQVGNLTCTGGTPTVDFQFGVIPPSTTVSPLEIAGDVDFTATPLVVVGGTSIATGTYPLIRYSGNLVGTIPTAASVPGYVTGSSIIHDPGTKTISLLVTASTFNPALSWRVGDGVWDINGTANWTQLGNQVNFNNGNAVVLDDTSSGASPIAITLNSTVSPSAVTVNSTKDYAITGSGSITGAASISLLGAGTTTLGNANTYSGGTTIGAGQLNINNGGNASSSSIGTGTLTINAGTLDNTSGDELTLVPEIPQTWNGNFNYLGSASNLNLGTGSVTLTNNLALTVTNNTLTVGGVIDGAFALTKTGNGILSLPAANTFTGGFTLSAGGLNVADSGSVGTGTLRLGGGTIDNTSGSDLTLSPSNTLVGSSFTFAGSNNLTLSGAVGLQTPNTPTAIVVTDNTLTLDGTLTLSNSVLTKSGPGTLSFSGSSSNTGGLIVQTGTVNLDKSSGSVITNSSGVTVQASGSLVITGDGGNQIASDSSPITPVILNGGSFDLNGFSERIDTLTMNSGLLRNSAAATESVLTFRTGGTITLDTSGTIEVTAASGAMTVPAPFVGTGALIKTGAGSLNLSGVSTYTGSTTVSAGTLTVAGSLGATAVTVSNAAILGGNGSIGGGVTIQSGATHALEIAANTAAQVTRVINGTLTLEAGNILSLTEAAPPAGGTYVLATANSIVGSPTTLNYSGSGTFSVDTASSPNRLLLTVAGGANYASWAIDNGIPGAPPTGDFENDGITNLVEYALGTDPKVSTQPAGVLAGNVITFTKGAAAIANGDVSWAIETSETLALGSWTPQVSQAAGDSSPTISYTFTPGSPAKNFARLRVIQAP